MDDRQRHYAVLETSLRQNRERPAASEGLLVKDSVLINFRRFCHCCCKGVIGVYYFLVVIAENVWVTTGKIPLQFPEACIRWKSIRRRTLGR